MATTVSGATGASGLEASFEDQPNVDSIWTPHFGAVGLHGLRSAAGALVSTIASRARAVEDDSKMPLLGRQT
jgi:hypothetical protein